MDPNAALTELRQLFDAANRRGLDPDDWFRLAELTHGLDGWLTRGGALPDAWQRQPA